jgi:hypothetical protein
MDYSKVLIKGNSREKWLEVVNHVGNSEERLHDLMSLFFKTDDITIKRTSQVIGMIGENQPELMVKYSSELVKLLSNTKIDAVKRNILRVFQFVNIPESEQGKMFDITLTFLLSNHEALAIRVFSMTVLRKLCEIHKELSQEVIETIEMVLEENNAGSIQSRGKKELKILRKI